MNVIPFELSSLTQLTCTILLITTILAWSQDVWPPAQKPNLKNFVHIGLILAGGCLTIALIDRWLLCGHIPLSNLYESCNFLSWSIIVLYILIHDRDWSILLISPTALLMQTFATFSLPVSGSGIFPLVPALQSNWLMMHVSMMIISYGLLILGSILAIIWLMLNDSGDITCLQLEQRFYSIRQTYMLVQIDYWSYRFIGLGFPLLTIGILAGAVWANEAWGAYWSWDPKETWALLTWIMFAIYLHVRLNKFSKGIQPAFVACVGLGVIWVCFLGVNLLGKGLHSYGWVLK